MSTSSIRVRTACLLFVAAIVGAAAFGQAPPEALSTSGPTPPPGCVLEPVTSKAAVTLPDVPAYIWRHGSAPTAVGMVAGYYDGDRYPDFFDGDGSTETAETRQGVASGGDFVPGSPDYCADGTAEPWDPGFEEHFEDYAMPIDCAFPSLSDGYLAAMRPAHADNSIADFMDTSRSNHENGALLYGWNWSGDVGPGFIDYAAQRNTEYLVAVQRYYWPGVHTPQLTFEVVKEEIDASRPMVFLVDSDGDANTDHYVTVIGYDDNAPEQYLYYSTWDEAVYQADFKGMTPGAPWGIYSGWAFSLTGGLDPFEFSVTPKGGWFEEGDSLSLAVEVRGAIGDVTYQWYKDGDSLLDSTDATFSIASLTLDDSGSYHCEATDDSKATIATPPALVVVFVAGSLPTVGVVGLGLVAAACIFAGAMMLGRRCD